MRKVTRDRVDASTLLHQLLESSFGAVPDGEIKDLLPHPGELTPGLAKGADVAATLYAATKFKGSSATLSLARQYLAFRRKYTADFGNSAAEDRRTACFNKFRNAQRRNRTSEKRLNFYFRHPSRMPPLIAEVLGTAAMDIQQLLGLQPSSKDWKMFTAAKNFSNGTVQGLATYEATNNKRLRKLKDTTAFGKLDLRNTVTITKECLQTFRTCFQTGLLGDHLFRSGIAAEYSKGAVGTSVSKDAEIDRFIAVEPLLNGVVQQGLRAIFEEALKRWGITLDDQGRNRDLAELASLFGFAPEGWATVDLTSASDTIVRALVQYLMPKRWFELLDAARSQEVIIEGKSVEGYSSFSTMGNATTFPLQCLIFGSLVRACIKACDCEDTTYRVYGDDLIVPIPATALLLEVLRFSGFTPNLGKTSIVGFFRESCGGDFLLGDNVTPVVVDEDLDLLTTRHTVFNLLQRRSPAHPALFDLLDSTPKPLIGPASSESSVESGHFECPHFKLLGKGRSWYDRNDQSVMCRHVTLRPNPHKVDKAKFEKRAYLAALSGQRYDSSDQLGKKDTKHGLRGSANYHARTVVTNLTVQYRLPQYALGWYK